VIAWGRRALSGDLLPITVLIAVTLAEFGPLLFGSRVLFFGDITLYFLPMLAFQRGELLHARLPLWNPTILCGTPFVGNPQAWPLYPSSFLLAILPASVATGAMGTLHLFWASLGTYLFLRGRPLGRGSALFAALAWGLGGALVSKMQFPNMVQAASYFPWLLYGIDRVVKRPTAGRAGVLGLLIGLSLLAAHPQMFLMQFYVGVAWAVFRVREGLTQQRRSVALLLTGAFCVGAMLAFGQLLPVIEFARDSVRAGLTLAHANRFVLPGYASLYNFVAPNFYGNPATNSPYIGRGNFWEPCAYAGELAFILSIAAIAFRTRRVHDVRFFAVVAGICWWLALGRDGGLYTVAFYGLPGLSKFHDAARWLLPGTFALACLSAYGLDGLLASVPVHRRALLLAVVIALNVGDLAVFTRTLNPTAPRSIFRESPGARAVRAYVFDERGLWRRFVSYRTYSTVEGVNAERFTGSLGPNIATVAGYYLVNGYEPVRRTSIDAQLTALAYPRWPEARRRLARIGVVDVLHYDADTERPVVTPVSGGELRARIGNRGLPVEDSTPDWVTIDVSRLRAPGQIVLADSDAPGWSASVDGRPIPVVTDESGAFRVVYVPGGARFVTMRYLPTTWRFGLFFSLFGSGILSSIGGAMAMKRGCRNFGSAGRQTPRTLGAS
jgi:hypothetical protein